MGESRFTHPLTDRKQVWTLAVGFTVEVVNKVCYLGHMLRVDGSADVAVTDGQDLVWLE